MIFIQHKNLLGLILNQLEFRKMTFNVKVVAILFLSINTQNILV